MTLTNSQKDEIKELLRRKIREKLKKYSRETTSMPFLVRLLQDAEKVASYSFIHSLSTTLGMSIYEEVAEIAARPNFDDVKRGFDVKGFIGKEESMIISRILLELKNGSRQANKEREIREILECKKNDPIFVTVKADLFLRRGEDEYYIEIKTAKPNIDVVSKSKEKFLRWVAIRKRKINTILAIPYNPYPDSYERFTLQGYLDREKELFVAEQFWDLLAGEGTYQDILNIFDEVGKELKDEINEKIREIARDRIDI